MTEDESSHGSNMIHYRFWLEDIGEDYHILEKKLDGGYDYS